MNTRQERPITECNAVAEQEYVLVAIVQINDLVSIVRAEDIGKALISLHGTPTPGLKVAARIEYALRTVSDMAELEEFDRLGLDHTREH